MAGGTKTEIVQPTPPAAPTPGESAAEFAAALPEILQAQLEFQPQFDEATFRSFERFAPEFARVGRETLKQFSPELAELDENLARQAIEQSRTGLSQDARDLFRDEFKALAGNQVNSGLGASFVARNLIRENELAKARGRNLGLSLQGKVPVTEAFQQPSNFQVANQFPQAFQTQSGTFGSVFSGAGRPRILSRQRPNYLSAIAGGIQGAGQFAASQSSITLKHDVKKVMDALDVIKDISAVNYKWKDSNEEDGGVIAEELEKVLPDAVVEIDGVKHVKPMMLMGYIIKSIQELNEKIDKLGE